MFKYAKIINQETKEVSTAASGSQWVISQGYTPMDVETSDVDGREYLTGFAPMKTDEDKANEEQERVGKLTMTKRVFALILKKYNISYSQLKELIATNEDAQLEWDLCSELQRNNPLLDIMAAEMNITPEQLDNMFKYANGEIKTLIPEEPTDEEMTESEVL